MANASQVQHDRFDLETRHSKSDVRFSVDYVRFTPESRSGSGRLPESEVDPQRKSSNRSNTL